MIRLLLYVLGRSAVVLIAGELFQLEPHMRDMLLGVSLFMAFARWYGRKGARR